MYNRKNYRKAGWALIFLSCVLFFRTKLAWSITIDEFDGQQLITQNNINSLGQDQALNNSALGGVRVIEVLQTQGSFIGVSVNAGLLSHFQGPNVIGTSRIIWDAGHAAGGQVNYSGLGGIDLLRDGGSEFLLDLQSFDFPFNRAVEISLKVYDAQDASGQTYSSASIMLQQQLLDATLNMPFSSFSNHGPSGAANFQRVGAIVLTINGFNPAIDLTLTRVRTNGQCSHVPQVSSVIIDDCGVCGGNNSSCADCLGVPNGSSLPGTFCSTGLLGSCRSGSFNGQCQCEQNLLRTEELCDGLDNDCNGRTDEVLDVCGVCGGDGLSCIDCRGIPFGTTEISKCKRCLRKNVGSILQLIRNNSNSQLQRSLDIIRTYRASITQLGRGLDEEKRRFLKRQRRRSIRHFRAVERFTKQIPAKRNTCDLKQCTETDRALIARLQRNASKHFRILRRLALQRLAEINGLQAQEELESARLVLRLARKNARTLALNLNCEEA